jgi:outer membrane receptor protein involved in Fe transport
MYYLGDTWTVGGGLRNVFNAAPPFFDPTESPTGTNASYGSGYDLFGRTAFVNVVYKWD